MAQINIYKWNLYEFFVCYLTVFNILTFQIFTLKIYVKGSGVILWSISASLNVTLMHFCISCHQFQDFNNLNCLPWKFRSRSWITTTVLMPFNGKYMTSYLMSMVMFALSVAMYNIFPNQLDCQNVNLENEGQGQ